MNNTFKHLILIGIPIVLIFAYLDTLISKNYTYTQFFGASLIEYSLFAFGYWLGNNIKD